jgi:hypothetical protein
MRRVKMGPEKPTGTQSRRGTHGHDFARGNSRDKTSYPRLTRARMVARRSIRARVDKEIAGVDRITRAKLKRLRIAAHHP